MPDWLPEMFVVDPWGHTTYDSLYAVFCRDIRDYGLRFEGNRVWIYPDLDDGKEVAFWHLTTRGTSAKPVPRRKMKFQLKGTLRQDSGERLPDFRRCERLPWVNPLIRKNAPEHILSWDYDEGGGVVKTYVWAHEEQFVVIMKRYDDGSRRLITSFYIDYDSKRDDLQKKYDNRIL